MRFYDGHPDMAKEGDFSVYEVFGTRGESMVVAVPFPHCAHRLHVNYVCESVFGAPCLYERSYSPTKKAIKEALENYYEVFNSVSA